MKPLRVLRDAMSVANPPASGSKKAAPMTKSSSSSSTSKNKIHPMRSFSSSEDLEDVEDTPAGKVEGDSSVTPAERAKRAHKRVRYDALADDVVWFSCARAAPTLLGGCCAPTS